MDQAVEVITLISILICVFSIVIHFHDIASFFDVKNTLEIDNVPDNDSSLNKVSTFLNCPYCNNKVLESDSISNNLISIEDITNILNCVSEENKKKAEDIRRIYGEDVFTSYIKEISPNTVLNNKDYSEKTFFCKACGKTFCQSFYDAYISKKQLAFGNENIGEMKYINNDELQQAKEIKRIYGDNVYNEYLQEIAKKKI